ncbi:PREDICTED: uncharacterized protein LOC104594242 [Nelumbo nucifera]|uniref:Transmembrane protein n=2 Tax=Nelumbo nucifera TaxID=4432 RepID=A0A822XPX6_NELNU|nr:PREDICTED: uncharacterized protein LOC104594242 [Nelumbo nucifera]DAD23654.1 TPA_asm: hypothetical protein HUJ06_025117 [Nelumbo nucifera]
MAAKVCSICISSSSSLSTLPSLFFPSKSSSPPPICCTLFQSPHRKRPQSQRSKIRAKLGGGDGDVKPAGKKKFITREEEPQQYWQTAGEREGENPMKTPLPYIIIFGMSTPFVILAIAFANGWIKVPVR